MNPVPRQYAREYLEAAPTLTWLVVGNLLLAVVGLRWYVDRGLAEIPTYAWPVFADSPAATVLAGVAFATLLPALGSRLEAFPTNLPLAYLHTLAFVWLVETGLWTVLALNLRFGLYFPEPIGYFGVIGSHLAFVAEAFLLPHAVRTTRGALMFALVCTLANDALDYGLGLNPPLRYGPGLGLAVGAVLTSLLAVGLAAVAFDRVGSEMSA